MKHQTDESNKKDESGGTGFFSILKRKNEMAGGATTIEWSNVEFWKDPTHTGWLTKQVFFLGHLAQPP